MIKSNVEIKNLTVKLTALFCTHMILSSLFAFFTINIFTSKSVSREIRTYESNMASTIVHLEDYTLLSLEEIVALTSTEEYPITIVTDLDACKLTDRELNILYDTGALYIQRSFFPIGTTLVKTNQGIVSISSSPNDNIFNAGAMRIAATLLTTILIGTVLVALSGKPMLYPIRALNKATKEVSTGNFDIQVPVPPNKSDEISILTANFNKMAKELKGMDTLRKDFVSNVSHEFKTPIASILGFATLLQGTELTEEQREYTDIIIHESTRLSKLSTNILKLTKLENQEIITDKKDYSLDEQLRRSVVLLEKDWSSKNISLNVELGSIDYYGSEELLGQVWLNLLSNAIKFTPEGGEISVGCYCTPTSVKVEIADNGIGMDEATQKRIFEKFFQGDATHASEGNGLGLPMVKRIVDLCGGNIVVKSAPGQGATFTVELPTGRQ